MIFRIDTKLYDDIEDSIIRSAIGEFEFKICKIKQGYFVYNKEPRQVAQIMYSPYQAKITVADCGTLMLYRDKERCFYTMEAMPMQTKDKALMEYQNKIDGEYAVAGSYDKLTFDIYYNAQCVMNVIPDRADPNYVKVRVNEGGNLIMLVMLVVAICKLNLDPKSEL